MPRVSKAEFIKLQKKLVTDAAIGEKLGVTRQAIHQLRNAYGLPSSLAGNSERNKKIVELRKKGVSVADIAKKFDLGAVQVYKIINDAGAGKRKKKAAKKMAKKKR